MITTSARPRAGPRHAAPRAPGPPPTRLGVAISLAVVTVVAVVAVLSDGGPAPPPPPTAPPPPRPAPPRWVVDPAATRSVADLVGPRAAGGDTAARFGIAGTDLGHMFTVDGRLAVAFGDTYGGVSTDHFFSAPHPDWRSNVLGFVDPPASPDHGLALSRMISDRPGHAAEILGSRKVDGAEWTVIPTYGIAVGRRMYLHYMSVRSFATPPGRWPLNDAGVAYSDDGGQTWHRPPEALWPGDTRFGQVAYVRPGGADDPFAPHPDAVPGLFRDVSPLPGAPDPWVYVYGIPGGRYGDVSLARVPADRLLDRTAYRYWTGHGWSPTEGDSVPVLRGPAGELSVRWNSYYRTWLMTTLVDPTGQIVLRTAPSPTGPWSAPQVVTTTRAHPEAYAPYLLPRWNDGPDIWFTMSQYRSYGVSLQHTRLRDADAPPP
ncbi:DUF4185 domain-containing protein [Actinomycetospora sp. TBRC 11914]|uniref:DUF4185 domain-containing protein n=1 Tax=Actinomycetospora sp. TBRC 11914 TaxID=2729387 RepID=UPI00145D32C4|nr:DUF4185 domain-containing protein [Actinomycetospora sp. TBRC 11914]NMO92994.1 DUF4185 domain-containing protein [Actinomycetospora sp. TBRC 11914]